METLLIFDNSLTSHGLSCGGRRNSFQMVLAIRGSTGQLRELGMILFLLIVSHTA